jgi:glutaredoxin
MLQKSGQKGVPVVDINGSIVVGFNRDEIDKLLGL